MSLRRKLKDAKLAAIKTDLERASAATERAFLRLRRAWNRFDKLAKRISYLHRRQAARERELDAEDTPSQEATP